MEYFQIEPIKSFIAATIKTFCDVLDRSMIRRGQAQWAGIPSTKGVPDFRLDSLAPNLTIWQRYHEALEPHRPCLFYSRCVKSWKMVQQFQFQTGSTSYSLRSMLLAQLMKDYCLECRPLKRNSNECDILHKIGIAYCIAFSVI